MSFVKLGSEIWRDYQTDGVPASGAQNIIKTDMRAWMLQVESFASDNVINFNSGDVLITATTNLLAFTGASSGYTFDAVVKPSADDAAALGASGTAWSDLYLASGGTINFRAGGIVITDNAGADYLAFYNASLGYFFDSTVGPLSNDAAALGLASNAWSDLFLASGAVVNFATGDVTITHASDALTFAGAANGYTFTEKVIVSGGIVGTTTNNNAASGNVGEYVSSSVASGSAVSLTTNVDANVTSISLTAGDWDVQGNVCFTANNSTSFTNFYGWISTTSATMPTRPNSGAISAVVVPATVPASGGSADPSLAVSRIRLSLSGTTTVYLSAKANFTVSTTGAYGFIGARRVR